jgi:hypothetical protein
LVILKNIDACAALKHPNRLQKQFIDGLKSVVPKMVHKCPFVVGEFFEGNYTFVTGYCPITDPRKPQFKGLYFWPDGDYRTEVSAFVGEHKVLHVHYYFREKTADNDVW